MQSVCKFYATPVLNVSCAPSIVSVFNNLQNDFYYGTVLILIYSKKRRNSKSLRTFQNMHLQF